ncbi:MAG: hypothetical protein JRG91_08615 [Deltaproteobacteria bacterium]|nr:hypothetical protein [Deltaproteobacteria bacterium]
MHALTRTAIWLVCLTLALPALAQEAGEEEKAEAKELFAEGVELYKDGHHAQALESFGESFEIRPHWRLHLNIGLCYMQMSMYTRARAEFDAFITKGEGELDAAALKLVNAELEKLGGIIAVLDIEILVEDALVELDGSDVGEKALGGPVEVDPGFHVLKAALEGEVFFREEFLVSKGERRTFEIALEEPEEIVVVPPPEPEKKKPKKKKKKKSGSKKSPAVWVMSALTIALTATAVTTGALAVKKHGDVADLDDQAMDLFESGGLTEDTKEDYLSKRKTAQDSGKALGYATTVFIVAAAASLAATIAVGVVTRSTGKSGGKERSVALSPVPLDDGGMLVVTGSF